MAGRPLKVKGIDFDAFITNYVGDQFSINEIIGEFSVFEDIFSSALKAQFVMNDATGLLDGLPILGQEIITLSFKTQGDDVEDFIELNLQVYKVSKRAEVKERQNTYVLNCVAIEQMSDIGRAVTQSYVNLPVSDIATNVFEQYIKSSVYVDGQFVPSDVEFEVEPTLNSYTINGNRTTPFQFITQLAGEAQSEQYPDSPFYLFYQDHEKFNFKSLNSMLEQEPVEDYYLANPNHAGMSDNGDEIKKYQIIEELTWLDTFDMIRNYMDGMFANQVDTIDPILKKYESTTFNYLDDFMDVTHITAGIGQTLAEFGELETGPAHNRYLVSQLGDNYPEISYLRDRVTQQSDPHLFHPRARHKYLAKALYQLASLNQYGLNLRVPGNSAIKCGDIIKVWIPESSGFEEDLNKYVNAFGQVYPYFIVTAVQHNYDSISGDYYTAIQCFKESFTSIVESKWSLG